LAVVAALDDMVFDAGNHDSRKSWHGRTLPETHGKGNWKVVPVPTLVLSAETRLTALRLDRRPQS
jgi:hypothetical protein